MQLYFLKTLTLFAITTWSATAAQTENHGDIADHLKSTNVDHLGVSFVLAVDFGTGSVRNIQKTYLGDCDGILCSFREPIEERMRFDLKFDSHSGGYSLEAHTAKGTLRVKKNPSTGYFILSKTKEVNDSRWFLTNESGNMMLEYSDNDSLYGCEK